MRVLSNHPPYSFGRLGLLSTSFLGGAAAATGAGSALDTLGTAGFPQLPKKARESRDVVVVGRPPHASTKSTWNKSKEQAKMLVNMMAHEGWKGLGGVRSGVRGSA
jgi:hypothetical protein